MSHRRKNIVLEGVEVRVRCKDEEVERTMVFHHILVSVPRTFGDYCNSDSDITQILVVQITYTRLPIPFAGTTVRI